MSCWLSFLWTCVRLQCCDAANVSGGAGCASDDALVADLTGPLYVVPELKAAAISGKAPAEGSSKSAGKMPAVVPAVTHLRDSVGDWSSRDTGLPPEREGLFLFIEYE